MAVSPPRGSGKGDAEQKARARARRNRMVAILRRIATFSALGDAALAQLVAQSRRVNLSAGDTLFRAGDAAECGYVLMSGRMELSDTRRDGLRHGVLEVAAEALIGEIALIAPTPRPATAVALEPCTLLCIPRARFLAVLEGEPAATAALRQAIAQRLEVTLKALDGVRAELEQAPTGA